MWNLLTMHIVTIFIMSIERTYGLEKCQTWIKFEKILNQFVKSSYKEQLLAANRGPSSGLFN
jgi:hypothetical protein